MQQKLILILLLILIVVAFAIQNAEPVTIRLFFWPVSVSPAVLIPATLLIGALLGILFSGFSVKKKSTSSAEKQEPENTGEKKKPEQ
jgi:uncharacterized integral membrane protein